MTTYLAGPINGCTDAEANDWRTEAKAQLHGTVLDPMDRDYRGQEEMNFKEIVEVDKATIRSASTILTYHPAPSTGTDMEILLAWQWGIPVIAIVPEGAPISPWLRYHTTAIVRTIRAACWYINTEPGARHIPLDPSNWLPLENR